MKAVRSATMWVGMMAVGKVVKWAVRWVVVWVAQRVLMTALS
jgi:hypothetical protein